MIRIVVDVGKRRQEEIRIADAQMHELKATEDLEAENARLRAIISEPVESFGTPELVSWADKIQRILSAYPEEERGNWPFVLDMGAHLQKFVKSWNDPEMAAKDARIAALERALRKAQDRIYYAVDWRHEGADETLKQVWREIEEALGEAAAPEEEEAEHVR